MEPDPSCKRESEHMKRSGPARPGKLGLSNSLHKVILNDYIMCVFISLTLLAYVNLYIRSGTLVIPFILRVLDP